MMKRICQAAGVLMLVAVVPLPALGSDGARPRETTHLVVRDVADDANGINSQGEKGFGPINVPTPGASKAGADLRKITFAGDLARGSYVISVQTSGPAEDGVVFTIEAEAGSSRSVLEHERGYDGVQQTTLYACNKVEALDDPIVRGRTMTFTFDAQDCYPSHEAPRIWIQSTVAAGASGTYANTPVLDSAGRNL